MAAGRLTAPMVKRGDRAPDFTLPDQDGNEVSLKALRGRPVVLYFYPMDDTPGCSLQTRAFAEKQELFLEHDAVLLGIGGGDAESHKRFAEACGASFPLLVDWGRNVIKAYDAVIPIIGYTKRMTVVIDREGRVADVYTSVARPASHPDEALEAVRRLASPPSP